MIIPIRCYSCGKVIAPYHKKFEKLIKEGKTPEQALDEIGLDKYCCRRMITSHVDLVDEILKFQT